MAETIQADVGRVTEIIQKLLPILGGYTMTEISLAFGFLQASQGSDAVDLLNAMAEWKDNFTKSDVGEGD